MRTVTIALLVGRRRNRNSSAVSNLAGRSATPLPGGNPAIFNVPLDRPRADVVVISLDARAEDRADVAPVSWPPGQQLVLAVFKTAAIGH